MHNKKKNFIIIDNKFRYLKMLKFKKINNFKRFLNNKSTYFKLENW